eukprot:CAMPEP_0170549288 /NCGR_PEP_ID=MMETSP0211-20121228/7456_1 /TAXON_ID=311385 /ORGANISM="Pseudokeronopsis sp., Strain OXSARD2" /LENGTH=209 /DNA_ID=CAMNT_0010855215 /DNA_START=74 /DNA_END=703 /DNA_ORIENTATION=+
MQELNNPAKLLMKIQLLRTHLSRFQVLYPLVQEVALLEELLDCLGIDIHRDPIDVECYLLGSFGDFISELLELFAPAVPGGAFLFLGHLVVSLPHLPHLIEVLRHEVLHVQHERQQLIHFVFVFGDSILAIDDADLLELLPDCLEVLQLPVYLNDLCLLLHPHILRDVQSLTNEAAIHHRLVYLPHREERPLGDVLRELFLTIFIVVEV